MEQKKYLKWYHKVGYGSGDVAGNCVYALLLKAQDMTDDDVPTVYGNV